MRFSEREGYIEKKLQIDSLNRQTRNRLWNQITDFIQSYYRNDRRQIYRIIWAKWLKKPIDEIPKDYRGVRLKHYDPDYEKQLDKIHFKIKSYFHHSKWHEIFDLLEFLVSQNIEIEKIDQFKLATNSILSEENSIYRFVGDIIVRSTSPEGIIEIEKAINSPIEIVNIQLRKALENYGNREHPDFRNSIKDAINAIETLCGLITEIEKPTLGSCLDKLENKITFHKNFKEAIKNLYWYASDAEGIRHGLKSIPSLDYEDAMFMLITCSSLINYLIRKAEKAGIILDKNQ